MKMNHDNLNPFYGIINEGNIIFTIHAFAVRDTLNDVLRNTDMRLDKFFKNSFIFDLIKGIGYTYNWRFWTRMSRPFLGICMTILELGTTETWNRRTAWLTNTGESDWAALEWNRSEWTSHRRVQEVDFEIAYNTGQNDIYFWIFDVILAQFFALFGSSWNLAYFHVLNGPTCVSNFSWIGQ